jgi:hypothetical protein
VSEATISLGALAAELASMRKSLAEMALIQAETLNALVDLGSQHSGDGLGLPGGAVANALLGFDASRQRVRLLDLSDRSLELAKTLVDLDGG